MNVGALISEPLGVGAPSGFFFCGKISVAWKGGTCQEGMRTGVLV